MHGRETKVWVFLITLCLIFLFVGQYLGGRLGLFIGLLLALALNTVVFFLGESRLLGSLKAQQWQGRDPWGVQNFIQEMAEKHQLPVADFYLLDQSVPTAFTVGFHGKPPCICLSTGLLQTLSPEDLRLIIIHQLCHANRLDSFSFGVTSIIANTLVGLGQWLDRVWPPHYFMEKPQPLFQKILSPLGWLVIRVVISPQTYLETDQVTAQMTASREHLAELLWRLEGFAQTLPLDIPPCTSHLFIVNPAGVPKRRSGNQLHPSMEARLRNLTGMSTI